MSSSEPPVAAPIQPESKRIEPTPVLPSGIEAGLIGGAAVAAVFLIRDVMNGVPMHTPSVLGTLLIEGPDAARIVESAPGVAAAYNALHFAFWVIAGALGAWSLNRVEESAKNWFLPWVGVAVLSVVCIGIDSWAGDAGVSRVSLWLGSIAGIAAMALFFRWRHPHAMAIVRGMGKT